MSPRGNFKTRVVQIDSKKITQSTESHTNKHINIILRQCQPSVVESRPPLYGLYLYIQMHVPLLRFKKTQKNISTFFTSELHADLC